MAKRLNFPPQGGSKAQPCILFCSLPSVSPSLQGKVKARQLRTMLSNLNVSSLGPCSSPQFRSPSGRVGSLEARTLASLTHGHYTGVAVQGKVVFSLASEGRMAL